MKKTYFLGVFGVFIISLIGIFARGQSEAIQFSEDSSLASKSFLGLPLISWIYFIGFVISMILLMEIFAFFRRWFFEIKQRKEVAQQLGPYYNPYQQYYTPQYQMVQPQAGQQSASNNQNTIATPPLQQPDVISLPPSNSEEQIREYQRQMEEYQQAMKMQQIRQSQEPKMQNIPSQPSPEGVYPEYPQTQQSSQYKSYTDYYNY